MATRAPDRLPWQDVIDAGRGEQVVREARYGGSPAEIEPLPGDLHPELLQALGERRRSTHLYSHQAEALRAARENHTIVTTGTASGKSLAFNLPVLDTLAHDRKARAIYLYPTKALAQDQARKLSAYRARFLRHAIYDGDTPRDERSGIRQKLEPDPDEPRHAQPVGAAQPPPVGRRAREPRLDRGRRGARLPRRVRLARGATCCGGCGASRAPTAPSRASSSRARRSPTRSSSAEGLSRRTSSTLVDRDGAPRAERRAVMWNPPLTDEKSGARRSALAEASDVLAELVAEEVRTICFMKSRRGVELLQKFTKQKLEDEGQPDLAERIAPYRAGYTPAQRREIERRLADGELLAVCATNALELGIDIGELDAAICVSFPGHGRVAAPDVGPRRAPAHRAGAVHRGRRRARPVLLPPPGRVPRPPGRERDPRLRVRGDPPRAPGRGGVRAAAERGGRGHPRPALAGLRRPARPGRRAAREATAATRRGPTGFAAGRIAMRSASTDSFAVVDIGTIQGDLVGTVESARAFRHDPPGRGLHAPRPELRGRGARAARPPRARPDVQRRLVHAAEDRDRHVHRVGQDAADARRRRAELRDRVGVRGGRRLPAQALRQPRADRPDAGRAARAALRDAGALVRAARARCCARSSRSTCSRARCTRPSTRRSRCCR